MLLKGFKRPTEISTKQGNARLLMEDMVKRTEQKLVELKRQKGEHPEKKFHKLGSLLTKEEIAQLQSESSCENPLGTPNCSNIPTVNQFRTVTSECNNLNNPTQGASFTPTRRLIDPVYEDGIGAPLGLAQAMTWLAGNKKEPFRPPKPSARYVSTTVVQPIPVNQNYNHMLVMWGQFVDHDITFTPIFQVMDCSKCEFTDRCDPIIVPPNDPVFGDGTLLNGSCLPFSRSIPVCHNDPPGSFTPRQQINEITSYHDVSTLYGSRSEVTTAVREHSGGRLKAGKNLPDGRPGLPIATPEQIKEMYVQCMGNTTCHLCGDIRCNEQLGLFAIHTLWFREHNRIAEVLQQLNKNWNDERVFQETRKIIGGLAQKITYTDYLPKAFGPTFINKFLRPYKGYSSSVDSSIPSGFSTAAYRYGHSLIRPVFDRYGSDYKPTPQGPLPLKDAFFNPSELGRSGMDNLIRGLVSVHARQSDEYVNEVLTNKLFEQEQAGSGMDLAALNLHRSRDHGLPGYTVWKDFCTKEYGISGDIRDNSTKIKLMNLYSSPQEQNLDNVELWVGGLSEKHLNQSLLGATFACIFGLTFSNLRDGDRFYYENPGVFTADQLTEIRKASLARVICENTGIKTIQTDPLQLSDTKVSCSSSQIPTLDLTKWKETSTAAPPAPSAKIGDEL